MSQLNPFQMLRLEHPSRGRAYLDETCIKIEVQKVGLTERAA